MEKELKKILIKKSDIAYAAGLFDGEGYVGIVPHTYKKKNKYYRIMVKIGMTGNPESLLFLKERWGGSLYLQGKADYRGYKNQIQWNLSNRGAEIFLKDIVKFLKIKKPQVRLALEFRRKKKNKKLTNDLSFLYHTRLKRLKIEGYQLN